MKKNQSDKGAVSVLRSAVTTIVRNNIILFPFCLNAFLQLVILEILYFAPRWPLNIFFGPVIKTFWSETYLHYPHNLLLIPKLYDLVQGPGFIFISSFCITMSIAIIVKINQDKTVRLGSATRETFGFYVHACLAALISFLCVMAFFKLYEMVFNRALSIRSQTGIFFLIKRVVIQGAPYFNLLLSVITTTLFAYVFPLIVIEKKKIFSAIWGNFKMLRGSFWTTFLIVLIPTLSYVLILLSRHGVFMIKGFPELGLLTQVMGVLLLLAIDATVYTAVTILYLVKREQK